MYRPLNTLPDIVLDRLVSEALQHAPSSRVSFLASLGTRVHASAVRVSFGNLAIPDDARVFDSTGSSHWPLMSQILDNPERYGRVVKSLVVQQPVIDSLGQALPLDSQHFTSILGACSNLEEIVWNSSFVPPDGICETIASVNPRLCRLICRGGTDLRCSDPQSSRTCQSKWDAPSLPLLSSLPLTSLHLSRLSQAGARALSVLLSNIGEDSFLEDVGFDIVWLDDPLCEKIVEAGRRIRTLKLGTRGTKLSDRGIVKIVEGCENLEDFVLEEVQGRLTRALWTKPSHYPAALRRFRVAINESASHHSWTADHFVSLQAIPFPVLRSFSLVRIEANPRLVDGGPVYDNQIDDIACLKPVPQDFVDKIRGAKLLSILECDWWAWSIADIKVILENCTELETIKLCLDAPFSKLLSLTSNFASLPNLRELLICVNPTQAPGTPPVPLVPFSQSSLPTPTGTPILKSKSALPQLLGFDQMQTQTLPTSTVGDPSMPLMREVKRFVRKCPKLLSLEWYGKHGRGTWTVTRPPSTTSKISINVAVDYVPPSISEAVWTAMLREKNETEAEQKGWTSHAEERAGQAWTGPTANAMAAERAAETEKEQTAAMNERERLGKLREGGRKARTLSVNVSNSGDNAQLPTPTDSSHSRSPVLKYSPLSPPPSASECSVSTALSSVSESAESNSSNGIDHSGAHKRAPSEPSPSPVKAPVHWRTRSTSSAVPKDKGEHPDYFSSSKCASSMSSSGNKTGRRRGVPNGSGRGFKKRAAGSEGESTGSHGADHARRGRGNARGSGHSSVSGTSGSGQTRKSSTRRSTD